MNEELTEKSELTEDVADVSLEVYPTILERVKAVTYDSLVVIGLMIIASIIISSYEEVEDSTRIITAVFIVLLYDPILTSIFGGTIGHMFVGIRVKRMEDETRNISFLLAFIRFLTKYFLGWIALLTVTGNAKRRAIHDMAAGSVVVYASHK